MREGLLHGHVQRVLFHDAKRVWHIFIWTYIHVIVKRVLFHKVMLKRGLVFCEGELFVYNYKDILYKEYCSVKRFFKNGVNYRDTHV